MAITCFEIDLYTEEHKDREAYPISLAMGLTIQIQTEALIAMFPCPILLQ